MLNRCCGRGGGRRRRRRGQLLLLARSRAGGQQQQGREEEEQEQQQQQRKLLSAVAEESDSFTDSETEPDTPPPRRMHRLPAKIDREVLEDIQGRTKLRSTEIQALYKRFRKIAPDGCLPFSRFCDTLGVLGMLGETFLAERLFKAFDTNRDNELSFSEFAVALGVMMRGSDDEKLDLSFRIFNPSYGGVATCLGDYGLSSFDIEEEAAVTSNEELLPLCGRNASLLTLTTAAAASRAQGATARAAAATAGATAAAAGAAGGATTAAAAAGAGGMVGGGSGLHPWQPQNSSSSRGRGNSGGSALGRGLGISSSFSSLVSSFSAGGATVPKAGASATSPAAAAATPPSSSAFSSSAPSPLRLPVGGGTRPCPAATAARSSRIGGAGVRAPLSRAASSSSATSPACWCLPSSSSLAAAAAERGEKGGERGGERGEEGGDERGEERGEERGDDRGGRRRGGGAAAERMMSLRRFEQVKAEIVRDSIGYEDFVHLLVSVEATRRALVGCSSSATVFGEAEVRRVFSQYSTPLPDGTRRMMLLDFKTAVRTSTAFLSFLGVLPQQLAVDTSAGHQCWQTKSSFPTPSRRGFVWPEGAVDAHAAPTPTQQQQVAAAQQQRQQQRQLQQQEEFFEKVSTELQGVRKELESIATLTASLVSSAKNGMETLSSESLLYVQQLLQQHTLRGSAGAADRHLHSQIGALRAPVPGLTASPATGAISEEEEGAAAAGPGQQPEGTRKFSRQLSCAVRPDEGPLLSLDSSSRHEDDAAAAEEELSSSRSAKSAAAKKKELSSSSSSAEAAAAGETLPSSQVAVACEAADGRGSQKGAKEEAAEAAGAPQAAWSVQQQQLQLQQRELQQELQQQQSLRRELQQQLQEHNRRSQQAEGGMQQQRQESLPAAERPSEGEREGEGRQQQLQEEEAEKRQPQQQEKAKQQQGGEDAQQQLLLRRALHLLQGEGRRASREAVATEGDEACCRLKKLEVRINHLLHLLKDQERSTAAAAAAIPAATPQSPASAATAAASSRGQATTAAAGLPLPPPLLSREATEVPTAAGTTARDTPASPLGLERTLTHATQDVPEPRGLSLSRLLSMHRSSDAPVHRMYMNRPNLQKTLGRGRRRTRRVLLPMRTFRKTDDSAFQLTGGSKGVAVHFGHENWNTVINIMVGIRLAAGRASSEPQRAVERYDFVMKEKFSILPKTGMLEGSHNKMCAVRFIDYAPLVFRRIREQFHISSDMYVRSVGPEQLLGNLLLGNLSSLSELVSEGRSGALFYYTADGKFMIKTVTKDSAQFMRSILRSYYEHAMRHPQTLLTRFYGLHAIRLKEKSRGIRPHLPLPEIRLHNTYFVVMGNVFHTPVEIHRRYDLKGSTYKRQLHADQLLDSTVALKDLDLDRQHEKINLGPERRAQFLRQLRSDVNFLRRHRILDYSLLLGIYYADRDHEELPLDAALQSSSQSESESSLPMSLTVRDSCPASGSGGGGGGGGAAKIPFFQRECGGMWSSDKTKIYYFGIIDMLTYWSAFKRLEHVTKTILTRDPNGISCVNPTFYAERFMRFMENHIT